MGGDWLLDKKQPFLQIGSRRVDPLGQVRSRITEGPLYNVQNYFQELQPKFFKPNFSPGYLPHLSARDPGEAVLKGRRNGGAEYIGEYISGKAY